MLSGYSEALPLLLFMSTSIQPVHKMYYELESSRKRNSVVDSIRTRSDFLNTKEIFPDCLNVTSVGIYDNDFTILPST